MRHEDPTDTDNGGRADVGACPPSLLIHGVPLPALLIAPDETIIASNQLADALFGLPDERERARTLGHLDAGSRSDVRHHFREITHRPERADEFATLHGANPVHVTLTPLRDTVGRIVAVLLVAVEEGSSADPSASDAQAAASVPKGGLSGRLDAATAELGEVKRELRALQSKLVEFDVTVGSRRNEFLAMLAHELRNPLAAVLNALPVIRRTVGDDAMASEALRVADRQLLHQARLLDKLLDASRVLLGKITLRKESVDLRTVVMNALDATRALCQARAQEVSLNIADEVFVVQGDADRLEQAVRNVLDNATKYAGTGGKIVVTLGREESFGAIKVRDWGIGIEADVLPRVFDLFVQGDRSLARSGSGLGLGLTLVRQLVELHGGAVMARSAGRNRGSEFEIRVPLSGAIADADEDAPAVARPKGPRHILIVEDNRDAREALRLLLELYGYRVNDAANGAMGIRMAVAGTPQIVLIDLGLPDLDGYEVARAIRNRLGAGVVLIALTGYGDAESRRRSEAAGFDLHLVKPVAPQELVRTLGSV